MVSLMQLHTRLTACHDENPLGLRHSHKTSLLSLYHSYARDRRRAMMNIHWRLANPHEQLCIIRQRLIRPLEMYLTIKCSDYGMFLLTRCACVARVCVCVFVLDCPAPSNTDTSSRIAVCCNCIRTHKHEHTHKHTLTLTHTEAVTCWEIWSPTHTLSTASSAETQKSHPTFVLNRYVHVCVHARMCMCVCC